MEPSVVTSLSGTFVKYTGELLAELKRSRLAEIDLEVLRLKRERLKEKLEDLERRTDAAVDLAKKNALADLVSRGLSCSSLVFSTNRSIENDANNQLAEARREYSRAIEEIALMERRINENTPLWRRPWQWAIGKLCRAKTATT